MRPLHIPLGLMVLMLTLCLTKAWAQSDLIILYTGNSRGHYRPIRT